MKRLDFDYFSELCTRTVLGSTGPRLAAMGSLMTCNPAFARGLREAGLRIEEYFNSDSDKAQPPLNCLLLGPPGAGKTFIARQLGGKHSFQEINLSKIDDPAQLTSQLERSKARVVFFDEFDVKMSGSSVVRFLLDPMTDKDNYGNTVFIFSGSYLSHIHVLRTLQGGTSNFDLPRMLTDLVFAAPSEEYEKEVLQLYHASVEYHQAAANQSPGSDVVAYLNSLDKMKDFLSRINGFLVQIPDISSPLETTFPRNVVSDRSIESINHVRLASNAAIAENIIGFVRELEPAGTLGSTIQVPGVLPIEGKYSADTHNQILLQYKNMLITERLSLVKMFLSEKFGMCKVKRKRLHFLSTVPLLHNIRSLRFLIEQTLDRESQEQQQGEFSDQITTVIQKKVDPELLGMHLPPEAANSNADRIWSQFVKDNSDEKTTVDTNGEEYIQIFKASKPLVSFVISNYCQGNYLEKCVESVDKQDYPYIEILICDDGSRFGNKQNNSKPKIEELVRQYDEKSETKNYRRLKFCNADERDDDNQGKLARINQMIPFAGGDYCVILDADDTLKPDFVSRCLDSLASARQKDSSIAFVYTAFNFIEDEKDYYKFEGEQYYSSLLSFDEAKQHLLDPEKRHNTFPEPALTLTSALKTVMPFSELRMNDEYSTKFHKYGRLLLAGWKGVYLDRPLFDYRIHNSNSSGIHEHKELVERLKQGPAKISMGDVMRQRKPKEVSRWKD